MLASSVYGYRSFQGKIPNGDRVPNPCDNSTIWQGVGHQNLTGGGPQNPFGIDFRANNKTWNDTLCEKDSDGDGYSNGQELGDPNCTWSVGPVSPSRTTNLTHPGICEPLGSSNCAKKNTWLTDCNSKFDCPAITRVCTTPAAKTQVPSSQIKSHSGSILLVAFMAYSCRQF